MRGRRRETVRTKNGERKRERQRHEQSENKEKETDRATKKKNVSFEELWL